MSRAARRSPGLSLALLLSLSAAACSDDSGGAGAPSTEDVNAGAGMGGGGDMAANGAGGSGQAGTNDQAAGGGGSGGGNAAQGGGMGNGTGFTEPGVCGTRATGVITADAFQIKEERFLLSDMGFGPEVCIVSFDVTRVGDAPPGCDENAGQQDECLWTHLVQYDNPTVVLDENGACANSELGMDEDAIAEMDGLQVAYGYVFEYQGHNSVLMVYDEQAQLWEPGPNAGWDAMSGDFRFDERRGSCRYAAEAPAPLYDSPQAWREWIVVVEKRGVRGETENL